MDKRNELSILLQTTRKKFVKVKRGKTAILRLLF